MEADSPQALGRVASQGWARDWTQDARYGVTARARIDYYGQDTKLVSPDRSSI